MKKSPCFHRSNKKDKLPRNTLNKNGHDLHEENFKHTTEGNKRKSKQMEGRTTFPGRQTQHRTIISS